MLIHPLVEPRDIFLDVVRAVLHRGNFLGDGVRMSKEICVLRVDAAPEPRVKNWEEGRV